MSPTPDDDLESYWDALRPAPPVVKLARNDLPSIMEVATAKTAHDVREWLRQRAKVSEHPAPLDQLLGEIVTKAVGLYWEHLMGGLKSIDTVGLIEVILSTQRLPAAELKGFVRALPKTMLERIVSSDLGATAGGIHALLSLEMLYRDGHESDYTLTALPSGGIEVAIRPRLRPGETVQFRLDESFSLQSQDGVETHREETPRAAEP